MAKRTFLPLFLSALLLASCSCSPSSSGTDSSGGEISTDSDTSKATTELSDDLYESFTVTFHTNGGSAVPAQEVAYAAKATRPADPIKEGYTFVDWYWDEICVTPFNFDRRIYAPTDVYAGWRVGSGPVITSEDSNTSQTTQTTEEDVTYVNYYLAGTFTTPVWGAGGVDANYRLHQLDGNLGYLTGVSLKKNDTFKAVKSDNGTDITDWYGGDPGAASGQTGWHTNTADNNNVVIDIDGSYTVYLNERSQVWLVKE